MSETTETPFPGYSAPDTSFRKVRLSFHEKQSFRFDPLSSHFFPVSPANVSRKNGNKKKSERLCQNTASLSMSSRIPALPFGFIQYFTTPFSRKFFPKTLTFVSRETDFSVCSALQPLLSAKSGSRSTGNGFPEFRSLTSFFRVWLTFHEKQFFRFVPLPDKFFPKARHRSTGNRLPSLFRSPATSFRKVRLSFPGKMETRKKVRGCAKNTASLSMSSRIPALPFGFIQYLNCSVWRKFSGKFG